MSAPVLNLTPDSTEGPVVALTLQIIKNAVRLNADAILLELDVDLHGKAQKEYEVLVEMRDTRSLTDDQFFFRFSRLPTAFNITYTIAGKPAPAAPISGELFENVVGVMLAATDIPPRTEGEIAASLETIKPTSNWTVESKDLRRRVELIRIRKA